MEGDGTNIGSRPEIALTANVHPSVSELFCSLAGLSNSGRAFSLKTTQNPRPGPQEKSAT